MTRQGRISRRELLKEVGLTTAAVVAGPTINRARYRLFASSTTEYSRQGEPTTVEHVLGHFDHVRKLIGPEHLGVGSDMDLYGYDAMPPELNKQLRAAYKGSYGFREKIDIEGLNHPKRMFDLTEGLIRRKYSDADIEGILGGNFERVLTQIWKI